MTVKQLLKKAARAAGFEVSRLPSAVDDVPPLQIPDAELYQPVYSPWRSPTFTAEHARIAPYTLVSEDRCYILASLAAQAARLDGEIWECGVYRGGTAMLLSERLAGAARTVRLFDTFAGMPATDAAKDWHKAGDFHDTSLEAVRSRVKGDFVHFHKGLIPQTFAGLEIGSHSIRACGRGHLQRSPRVLRVHFPAALCWRCPRVRRLWIPDMSGRQVGGRRVLRGPPCHPPRAADRPSDSVQVAAMRASPPSRASQSLATSIMLPRGP